MDSKIDSSNSSLSSRKSSPRKRRRKRSNKSVSSECNTEKEEKEIKSPWYWSNYYKALMWQSSYEVQLWKSYAQSLEYEKMCLLQELYRLQYRNSTHDMARQNEDPEDPSEKSSESGTEENESSKDEEIEFEMSEEMIKFFEQSFRHKLEMKMLKEKEAEQFELEVKQLKEARELREKEMKLLYGEGSCMIIGMETAVQLSFDKYCDLKSPQYWPNIPLNL